MGLFFPARFSFLRFVDVNRKSVSVSPLYYKQEKNVVELGKEKRVFFEFGIIILDGYHDVPGGFLRTTGGFGDDRKRHWHDAVMLYTVV